MVKNVSLFFVPTEMEEFKGESFFLIVKLTLLWPFRKKTTHNNRDGGHYLMAFLPPRDFSFLILCHGLRVSSCESQKGGRNRKRRREELRHSEWGRGLNRRHVINIYNRRRQWRISVCSGSRRRAERSNEKKSRLKRGRESAGDWAWTGARELWMESQKIAHEGMKTLGNKYN